MMPPYVDHPAAALPPAIYMNLRACEAIVGQFVFIPRTLPAPPAEATDDDRLARARARWKSGFAERVRTAEKLIRFDAIDSPSPRTEDDD